MNRADGNRIGLGWGALALAAMVTASGCHSTHIDITVENHSGGPIRLLEVDYPNASFGADDIASEGTMHYRIQLQGNGPVKVQYTARDGKLIQISGPQVVEHQEGKLEIVLLPNAKADFLPHLTGPH
jgi:hypothetical protein